MLRQLHGIGTTNLNVLNLSFGKWACVVRQALAEVLQHLSQMQVVFAMMNCSPAQSLMMDGVECACHALCRCAVRIVYSSEQVVTK